jgi:hypothetical protein
MTLSSWHNNYFSKIDPSLGNEEVHSSILCGSTIPHRRQRQISPLC